MGRKNYYYSTDGVILNRFNFGFHWYVDKRQLELFVLFRFVCFDYI